MARYVDAILLPLPRSRVDATPGVDSGSARAPTAHAASAGGDPA